MAKHTLKLHLPPSTIVNSDAEIVVYFDNAIRGRLLISKGVDWWPANNRKFHYRLGWGRFAGLIEHERYKRAVP